MREVEGKLLNINFDEFISKLEHLGAKKIFDENLGSIYFDNSNGDFSTASKTLRLRSYLTTNSLCYKESLSNSELGDNLELEINFSDLTTMKLIFEKLGFKFTDIIKKHRISYFLDDVRIDIDNYLDDYSFIPLFAEIESDSHEKVYALTKKLGFKKQDLIKDTLLDLIKKYKK